MVIVENGSSALPRNDTVKAMFADRKSVFVDLLKWELPVVGGCFELDEFDDCDATYIIIADEDGDHLGSARLLPTTKPHLLNSFFQALCVSPPPTGDSVMEISRFCLSRRQRAAERKETRNLLVSALVSNALERGIRTYTGVAEIAWLQQILAFGWHCRPLGPPMCLESGMIGALRIDVDRDTPRLLAASGMWSTAGECAPNIAKAA